ncbi:MULTISPECIES: M15 family metallopeptidase [Sphingobacterium]|uniref:M15 family metallopeptidase n=1 Tax=Sphingobacterium TaxID=28453 RepID=UPI0013DCA7A6|nr:MULTISPECIES: M15 family metallopeptidase [unclassified Sphingobacterium]
MDKRLEFADKISLERIDKLHPIIRNEVKELYLTINFALPKGVRLRISQGLRSISEQDALYAQGRTTKGKIVTNAKGGSSWHNYGLAFDFVLLYDKDLNGTFETASWDENKYWMQVVNEFKKHGYAWGGDWRFKDSPHFEKAFGLSTATAMSRMKAGDVLYDNNTTYININKI